MMDHDEFFTMFGKLPVQFATHVYGAPVTVEELYRQFAARFYAEHFGDKAPKIQAGGMARRAPRQRKEPVASETAAPGSMSDLLASVDDADGVEGAGANEAPGPEPAESVETGANEAPGPEPAESVETGANEAPGPEPAESVETV